jgi:hypothetical protein
MSIIQFYFPAGEHPAPATAAGRLDCRPAPRLAVYLATYLVTYFCYVAR